MGRVSPASCPGLCGDQEGDRSWELLSPLSTMPCVWSSRDVPQGEDQGSLENPWRTYSFTWIPPARSHLRCFLIFLFGFPKLFPCKTQN